MLTLLFNLIVIVKNTSTAVTTISIDMIVKLKLVDLFNVYNSDIVYIELEITWCITLQWNMSWVPTKYGSHWWQVISYRNVCDINIEEL